MRAYLKSFATPDVEAGRRYIEEPNFPQGISGFFFRTNRRSD